MERKGFFKVIATLVVAPTLLGDIVISPNTSNINAKQFDGDRIKIYTKQAGKCCVRDVIVSDRGDKALIVTIALIGNDYIEAIPMIRGRYYYSDLNNFRIFSNAFQEKQKSK